jgi:ribosomal peptide maturation radical SAM protein 1
METGPTHLDADVARPRVALVSMPWMAPSIPSIQLATLDAVLRQHDIAADVHELFIDYAAAIGLNLYNIFSSLLGFHAEWLFARHYYHAERGDDLSGFRAVRPRFGLISRELEDQTLDVLWPVTEAFLDRVLEETDWSKYDVIGFSLTISQVASSMALARLIKLRHPGVTIVFGGAGCAGPMGAALLRACPYVDVVVRVEGELVLPEIVRRVRSKGRLDDLPGVCVRGPAGKVIVGEGDALYGDRPARPNLNYDAYFARVERCGLKDRLLVWLPFEGSRGCWYGEKIQCTFCGLHDIMKFRGWPSDVVLEELEHLHARYGIGRFFAVDLILPREYFRTLLPEIIQRGHRWVLFYEVKANMRREEVELLGRSGVRWIQPGIESLDRESLDLMRKGVTPLQNIQLLKWCQEQGIRVSWNIICGLPGAKEESYDNMAALTTKIAHLPPPSGVGRFQLHRFSPYFDRPSEHGLRVTGAHPLYRSIFLLPKEDLDDLTYMHEFELDSPPVSTGGIDRLKAAVMAWVRAHERGTTMIIYPREDGGAVIIDKRQGEPIEHRLSPAEASLYDFLDSARATERLAARFALAVPQRAGALRHSEGGIEAVLERWKAQNLVLEEGGHVLALASRPPVRIRGEETAAPVPYLEHL